MPDVEPLPAPATLLAEARALSMEVGAGEAPIDTTLQQAEAALYESGYRSEPGPTVERDPLADQPYTVDPAKVAALLTEKVPEAAAQLGAEGVAEASTLLAHMPREIVACFDEAGLFGSPLSWQLLAQIERNAGRSTGAPEIETDIGALASYAREMGFATDDETIAGVTCLLNTLPPRVLSGLSPEMARDPDLWQLAGVLGNRLWGFTLTCPVRS